MRPQLLSCLISLSLLISCTTYTKINPLKMQIDDPPSATVIIAFRGFGTMGRAMQKADEITSAINQAEAVVVVMIENPAPLEEELTLDFLKEHVLPSQITSDGFYTNLQGHTWNVIGYPEPQFINGVEIKACYATAVTADSIATSYICTADQSISR